MLVKQGLNCWRRLPPGSTRSPCDGGKLNSNHYRNLPFPSQSGCACKFLFRSSIIARRAVGLILKSRVIVVAFFTLGWTSSCLGQTAPLTPVAVPQQHAAGGVGTASAGELLPGTISGTVVDQSGAVL